MEDSLHDSSGTKKFVCSHLLCGHAGCKRLIMGDLPCCPGLTISPHFFNNSPTTNKIDLIQFVLGGDTYCMKESILKYNMEIHKN